MAADPHPDVLTEISALIQRLERARPYNIGFPGATDFDYTPLLPLFATHLLNNVGDPWVDGVAANHTKPMEREVVTFVADLLRAHPDDRWGYVTSGGSEGNLYGLHLARSLYPDGLVYASDAAHYSIMKGLGLLTMPSIVVRTDERGEMDYIDLADQIDRHRHRPAIVVASVGTTLHEAVDDVRRITEVLDALAVRRRFIHADAALSGIPLALLAPRQRPGFDLADGADTVSLSGHKFFGSPEPCGVVVAKASDRARVARTVGYTGSPDSTITGSRSGHAPLLLWYAIRRHGIDGLRLRAEQARELAAYTHARLVDMGWEACRHPHAFTVVLRTPPAPVVKKWVLATEGGWSHIITMPGVARESVDAFLADVEASIASMVAGNGGVPAPRTPPCGRPDLVPALREEQ